MLNLIPNAICIEFAADLEKVRQKLAVKHAESVRDCEKQMRSVQLERQAVFQDAFQCDMDYYKEVGRIPSELHSIKHSECDTVLFV